MSAADLRRRGDPPDWWRDPARGLMARHRECAGVIVTDHRHPGYRPVEVTSDGRVHGGSLEVYCSVCGARWRRRDRRFSWKGEGEP